MPSGMENEVFFTYSQQGAEAAMAQCDKRKENAAVMKAPRRQTAKSSDG